MNAAGQALRPIRALPGREGVEVIDQRLLPHRLQLERLHTPAQVHTAIRDMWVRGAPLIGATAAYGLALQMNTDAGDTALEASAAFLRDAGLTVTETQRGPRRNM